jgi:LacI family transcriptional regulator
VGVSHATVSRALNGRGEGFISTATRELILQTAKDMGYRPNAAARALATRHTGVIAVWINAIDTPFYAQILHHLEEMITLSGYALSLTRHRQMFQNVADALEVCAVDGVIAVDLLRDQRDVPVYDPTRHVGVVFIGAHSPQAADFVHVDLQTGAQDAVQHLLHTGCRRIAYLVHEEMACYGEARFDAYHRVLGRVNYVPEVITIPGSGRASVRESFGKYVQKYGHPNGILCQSDDIAMAAFRTLRDQRLRIPEDVRLIGCDGITETSYFDPPLSTIEQPIKQMCTLAWEFLLRRITQPAIPAQHVSLPVRLLIRGSS